MKKEYINQRIRSIDALVDMHNLQIDSSKAIIKELQKEKEELLKQKEENNGQD